MGYTYTHEGLLSALNRQVWAMRCLRWALRRSSTVRVSQLAAPLEAFRKVRASHPELVAQLDIMSQPAANVDSVILGVGASEASSGARLQHVAARLLLSGLLSEQQ